MQALNILFGFHVYYLQADYVTLTKCYREILLGKYKNKVIFIV